MSACWADTAARDYADEQGREVERDLAVEALAAEMMVPGAEYDPLKACNLGEAWGEYENYGEHELMIAGLLIAGKDAEVGAYLRKISKKYWKRLAMIEAETQIDEQDDDFDFDPADYEIY